MKKLYLILSIIFFCRATGFAQQSPPLINTTPIHQPPVLGDHSDDNKTHATNGHYKQHKYKFKKRHFRRRRK